MCVCLSFSLSLSYTICIYFSLPYIYRNISIITTTVLHSKVLSSTGFTYLSMYITLISPILLLSGYQLQYEQWCNTTVKQAGCQSTRCRVGLLAILTQMMKPPLTFSASTTFSTFHKPPQTLPRQDGRVVSGQISTGKLVVERWLDD